jgi:predicted metal-binding protein
VPAARPALAAGTPDPEATMTLLICRTCPRYDPRATGEFGRRLTAALAQVAENEPDNPIAIRNVQCLGGCPDDGVVAVDAPGKARVRFTGLDESDAKAVYAAALAHDACLTGAPEDWEIPAELADRISSVTLKRTPRAPDSNLAATRPNPLIGRASGRWVVDPHRR